MSGALGDDARSGTLSFGFGQRGARATSGSLTALVVMGSSRQVVPKQRLPDSSTPSSTLYPRLRRLQVALTYRHRRCYQARARPEYPGSASRSEVSRDRDRPPGAILGSHARSVWHRTKRGPPRSGRAAEIFHAVWRSLSGPRLLQHVRAGVEQANGAPALPGRSERFLDE